MPPKTFASGAAPRTGLFIACESISMAVLVFQVYFHTVFVIEKKRNLAPKVYKNMPFLPQNLKKLFWRGVNVPFPYPSPCGEGDNPPHTPPPLAPSAPQLRGSTLAPPTLTSGFPYVLYCICNKKFVSYLSFTYLYS